MGLIKKIKQKVFSELTEIIEWIVHTPETIIWRFSGNQAEIKNGAQLIVREKQIAVLAKNSQLADVYQQGNYKLIPINMPILSTLKGWKYNFSSSFKVDVYFVNTKQFLNFHWDTEKPIKINDPKFGAIRLRAFGSYSFRVQDDPIVFIRNVAGRDGKFTTDSVIEQLRKFVIAKFTNYLKETKIDALKLVTSLNEFSNDVTLALKKDFTNYGIELTKFSVENISLSETVKAVLDEQTSKSVVGKMVTYTQMHFTDSAKDTVNN